MGANRAGMRMFGEVWQNFRPWAWAKNCKLSLEKVQ